MYLVIASDGVWDVIEDKKLKELLHPSNTISLSDKLLAQYLVKKTVDFGSRDNISCIVISL
jgi:serine/threonine protein phosphatase PrpC